MPLPFAPRRDLAAHTPTHCALPAATPLHAPAAKTDTQTLDAVNALDHGCVWPTHRLRCFLQLQHSKAFAGSL